MRCTECEEIELARVRDERPVQTMPVPVAALAGLPEGRSSADVTRRRLMQGGVAGLASIYGPKLLGWESVWESVGAEAAPPDQRCLVLIYLAGGNDGLNTIVPNEASDYAAYAAARHGRGGAGPAGGAAGAGGGGGAAGWAARPRPRRGGGPPLLAFSNVMV